MTKLLPATLAALLLLGGCSHFRSGPDWVIPEMDTAEAQLEVAYSQDRRARNTFDVENRTEEYAKAIAAYELVIERFPTDRDAAPLALLRTAELQRDQDNWPAALELYEEAVAKHPENPQVHAGGLYGMGLAYDELKQPQRAQAAYKALIEQYGADGDPQIRELARAARLRYQLIR
ncbi:MAG: tetratricopeptide repeat protein [Candidatus Sumerlaeia bacterium]|nr:tetratricopeptide repeat protein [Candidatus Sumerlaeia bacterium]